MLNLANTFSFPEIEIQSAARVSGAKNISKVHICNLRTVLRDSTNITQRNIKFINTFRMMQMI